MGMQGVVCTLTRSEISEALKSYNGKITYAAKHLKVCYQTLKNKIDSDPELVSLLHQLRNEYDSILLDTAEGIMLYSMQAAKSNIDHPNLSHAINCAKYVLNKKGGSRGYLITTPEITNEPDNIRVLAQIASGSNQDLSRASEPFEPSVENQQPILHQERSGRESTVQDELGPGDSLEGAALL